MDFTANSNSDEVTRGRAARRTSTCFYMLPHQYLTHLCTQSHIRVNFHIIRRNKASKSNFKNSTLFVRINYVSENHYFVHTGCKVFISSKCHDLTAETPCFTKKKYINFEIFDRSRHRLPKHVLF